jgi:hypothetical protein
MAATNRYMNIVGVGFTPSGGSSTPITGVKSLAFDEGVSVQKESADGDLYPTVSVNDHTDPTITVTTLDAFVLIAVLAAAKGTLVATIQDAYNKSTASGGGKTYTMSNCQIQSRGAQHAHRQFSNQSLTFGAVSGDGQTHPVAVTAL